MPEPFLAVERVSVRFGGLVAVEDVSVTADRGEIVGLIGPNGAGKTTFFGVISGLVRPVAGQVAIDGLDVTAWPPHRRARAGIARTFQKLEVFGSMTVRENLLFATEAGALGARPIRLFSRTRHQRPEIADEIIELLALGDVIDEPCGSLPSGTGRLVEFGRALCTEPSLLLLDEPSSGLDATETATFAAHVAGAVRETGVGVLLIEHDMTMVSGICERLYVLDFGRLIAEGPTAEVSALPDVRKAYLGSVTLD